MLDSYDPRWGDDSRDREATLAISEARRTDPREREQVDPRDVFMDHVDLPRGLDREHVHTATTTTPFAGLKRARWPRWAPSAWSPRATSATSSMSPSTPARASSGTFASQVSFTPFNSTATRPSSR